MTRKNAPPPRELAGNTEIERLVRAARESAVDPAFNTDDLAPARPNVWLVFVWLAVCAVMAMLLTACGAGIDDADELYGPPNNVSAAACCPPNVPCECKKEPG
jgi:hypothetical protein